MTIEKFKKKIQGKSVSYLMNSVINRVLLPFHMEMIRYDIMTADLTAVNDQSDLNVEILPMKAEDTDCLPADYFAEYDHQFKKNALLRHDAGFEGFICHDKTHTLIGYCWIIRRGSQYEFFRIQNTDAYVAEFYIGTQVRGQGLGPEMLLKICRALRENGAVQIKLAVRKDNRSAIRCYSKAGFTKTGNHTVFRNVRKRKVFPYKTL